MEHAASRVQVLPDDEFRAALQAEARRRMLRHLAEVLAARGRRLHVLMWGGGAS